MNQGLEKPLSPILRLIYSLLGLLILSAFCIQILRMTNDKRVEDPLYSRNIKRIFVAQIYGRTGLNFRFESPKLRLSYLSAPACSRLLLQARGNENPHFSFIRLVSLRRKKSADPCPTVRRKELDGHRVQVKRRLQ